MAVPKKKCSHVWKIFHDAEAVKTGYLTFFCQHCLMMVKKKKEYVADGNN
jgi:hypothetical protein